MAVSPPVREFALRALVLLLGLAAAVLPWVADVGMPGGFLAGLIAGLALAVAFSRWERPWILRPPTTTGRS